MQREEITEPQLPRVFAEPNATPQSLFGESNFVFRNRSCSRLTFGADPVRDLAPVNALVFTKQHQFPEGRLTGTS